jgi:Tol biopolymer transport system component
MVQRGVSEVTGRRTWRAAAIAGWLLAAGATAAALAPRYAKHRAPETAYRFAIDLPDSVVVANNVGIKLAISRDGAQLAVVGMKQGHRAIYLRRSAEVDARLVPGTDSGFSPSFSPDGRWLLYQSGDRLWKVPTAGGSPSAVLDSASSASWGDDGSIVFEKGGSIWTLAANGTRRLVASPDREQRHRRYAWPEVLPGSRHALITLWRGGSSLDSARLGIVSLGDGTVSDLGIAGVNPHYAAPGYIVYARSGGAVDAVPFSLGRRAVTGSPAHLLDNVWHGGGGGTDFSVSDNGVLAYHGGVPDAAELSMSAVDLEGRARELAAIGRERFGEPRVSPDGRHMAVAIGPPQPSDTGDVWVYDLTTGARTRLTSHGLNIRPEWTRDGSRVTYIARERDSQFVVARRPDGTGAAEVLARGKAPAFYELSFGPAHGVSAIRTGLAAGGSAIVLAPTDSLDARRPFDAGARVAITPKLSPDGRLLAFVTTENGRRELFVRPVGGDGPRVAVSTEGGTEPVWSPDGGTLYFRGLTDVMAATVTERPTLAVGTPRPLFEDTYFRSVAHPAYDVLPGGRELLMLSGWSRAQTRAYLLVNWTRAMRDDPPVRR